MHRPNQVNRVGVAALKDPFCADVAGIHQVFSRQQTRCNQMLLDRVEGMVVLFNRWSGMHAGDEMRAVVVAALGQMDLVAKPFYAPLSAVAHIRVIGRAEPFADRRALLW